MIERIFGTECEYAPTYQTKDNAKIAWMSEEELLDHLKGVSVMLFSSLKRKGYPMAGEFLGNGGRLYIDRGGHPEKTEYEQGPGALPYDRWRDRRDGPVRKPGLARPA